MSCFDKTQGCPSYNSVHFSRLEALQKFFLLLKQSYGQRCMVMFSAAGQWNGLCAELKD